MISGATELVAIVGHPVSQVKSPSNFNEYFEGSGQDLAMIAMDVRAQSIPACVEVMRGWENLRGCVVTIPHKQAFGSLVDELSERARILGSVNVVRREADGKLVGDMVDGLGFLNAARVKGFEPRGARALVVGAGGAGGAIAYALCEAGAAELTILDVDASRRDSLACLLQDKFRSVMLPHKKQSLASLDLVVNATPIGMEQAPGMPLPDRLLQSLEVQTLVADVVTSPVLTTFLKFAAAKGCQVQSGPEMARAQLELLGSAMGVMPPKPKVQL